MPFSANQSYSAALAGLGFAYPLLLSTNSLNEYNTCWEWVSDSDAFSAPEPTPFPSPSAEHILYPRLPHVVPGKYTGAELASATSPAHDSLPAAHPSTHTGPEQETGDGYEGSSEGAKSAFAQKLLAKRARTGRCQRAALVAGVAPSSSSYKRARAYAASGLGRGLPSGVPAKATRRTAYTVSIPKHKRAIAYAGLGLGLPSSAKARLQRSTAGMQRCAFSPCIIALRSLTYILPVPSRPLMRATHPPAPPLSTPSLLGQIWSEGRGLWPRPPPFSPPRTSPTSPSLRRPLLPSTFLSRRRHPCCRCRSHLTALMCDISPLPKRHPPGWHGLRRIPSSGPDPRPACHWPKSALALASALTYPWWRRRCPNLHTHTTTSFFETQKKPKHYLF